MLGLVHISRDYQAINTACSNQGHTMRQFLTSQEMHTCTSLTALAFSRPLIQNDNGHHVRKTTNIKAILTVITQSKISFVVCLATK